MILFFVALIFFTEFYPMSEDNRRVITFNEYSFGRGYNFFLEDKCTKFKELTEEYSDLKVENVEQNAIKKNNSTFTGCYWPQKNSHAYQIINNFLYVNGLFIKRYLTFKFGMVFEDTIINEDKNIKEEFNQLPKLPKTMLFVWLSRSSLDYSLYYMRFFLEHVTINKKSLINAYDKNTGRNVIMEIIHNVLTDEKYQRKEVMRLMTEKISFLLQYSDLVNFEWQDNNEKKLIYYVNRAMNESNRLNKDYEEFLNVCAGLYDVL